MRSKLLVITLTLLIVLLATPLAVAKPGAEKSNEKFEYFKLVCSGTGDSTTGTVSETYLNGIVKTRHIQDRSWITGSKVELTVGDETFTLITEPFSVDYTTSFDAQMVFNNDGTQKHTAIRLTDVVTVYFEDEEIGTLVLNLVSAIEYTDGSASGYSGTVMGYGTGALADVHVSGLDVGLVSVPPPVFMRVGTITGWPEQITNIS